ncbi:MAG: 3-oxoacyl-ACP synthase [bacterium]|nr:3-oxoacyl-ACP synthase [bacterium]
MIPSVGIVDLAVYLPAQIMSAEEVASRSGIPAEVVREKFGLRGKHIAASDEHLSHLCIEAARPLLSVVPAEEIDVVIYFGSYHRDYYVWPVAPRIQHALGLHRAHAFELMNTSAGGPIALKVAADMLRADATLRTILVVAGSRESYLLDYQNARSRFMFNFGDGAAAALLRRGHPSNRILGGAFLTDGAFAMDVMVPAGGSVHPTSPETVARGMHSFDVPDPAGMKARLDPLTITNFLQVIRTACERSGHTTEAIGFLAVLHTKRSLHDRLLAALGLREDQSVYLDTTGHLSAADPLVALHEGRRTGRLRDGMLAVAVSAGTGYSWGAVAIQWGDG